MRYYQRNRYLLFTILVFVCFGNSFATPQVPDYIIIKKDTFPLYTLPLQQYLEENKIAEKVFVSSFSSACYRGYQALWQISNDSIFLVRLNSCVGKEIPFEKVFKKKALREKIFAKWITDTLWAQTGEKVYYEHGGFGNFYEKELCVKVVKGKVISRSELDYRGKIRISKLDSEEYFWERFVCKNIEWNKLDISDQDVHVFIKLSDKDPIIQKTWGPITKTFENEALRLAKFIKPSVLYQYGRRISYSTVVTVKFSKKMKEDCKKYF